SGGGCGGVADEPAGAGPDGVPGVEEGLGRAEALPVGRGGGGLLRGGGFVRGRGGVRAGGWRVRRGGRGVFGGRFGEVFGLVPPPVRQPGCGRAGRLGGVGGGAAPPRLVGGGRRRGGGWGGGGGCWGGGGACPRGRGGLVRWPVRGGVRACPATSPAAGVRACGSARGRRRRGGPTTSRRRGPAAWRGLGWRPVRRPCRRGCCGCAARQRRSWSCVSVLRLEAAAFAADCGGDAVPVGVGAGGHHAADGVGVARLAGDLFANEVGDARSPAVGVRAGGGAVRDRLGSGVRAARVRVRRGVRLLGVLIGGRFGVRAGGQGERGAAGQLSAFGEALQADLEVGLAAGEGDAGLVADAGDLRSGAGVVEGGLGGGVPHDGGDFR